MRAYERSHPWLNFSAAGVNTLPPQVWMLLGEAWAICRQLAGTPLQPGEAERLDEMALVKGVQATTAIEGNTLTEEEVRGILRGTCTAPPSRAYQEREVRNVIDAVDSIGAQALRGEPPRITAGLIREFNRRVLDGAEYAYGAIPGQVRSHSVIVAGYRGAPAGDCAYLLERLADWLESDTFRADDPMVAFALELVRAVCAHLYIAWIHPFGDGNGRTARLLEFALLVRSRTAPVSTAHVLSNHYNRTRDHYYRELADASRNRSITKFLVYAITGLIDGLREQVELVRNHQMGVAWTDYVHEVMREFPPSPTRTRQRSLVLALPWGETVSRAELPGLTPQLAVTYAKVGPRTLSRDLNRLAKAGLIVREGRGWRSNHKLMRAFLPPAAAN